MTDINNARERRSESRLDNQTTVFIEIVSAAYNNSSPANIIVCNSLDLSTGGIQVEIDEEVPVGSILRLGAQLQGSDQTLYLVGEAKWLKKDGEHFNIGFELYDAEKTDFEGWQKVVTAMLNDDAANQ